MLVATCSAVPPMKPRQLADPHRHRMGCEQELGW